MAIGAAAIEAGGTILGGVAQGYGSKKSAESSAAASRYGADIQNKIALRNLQAEQALTPLQVQEQANLANAYRSAYQKTGTGYQKGEQSLASRFEQTPEALNVLEQQALTGQAEELQQGMGQLNTGLAQAGVRGGQAATQMRHGIGEMTQGAVENIQGLKANEAISRANQQREYEMAKQQAQQAFLLNPESAQYSTNETPEQTAYRKAQLEKYQAVGR